MNVIGDVKNESLAIFNKAKSQLTAQNLVRYLVEGIAVAIAAYVIPNRRTKFNEVAVIAIIAALSLFVLDVFSSDVGAGSRLGAGFGIGYNLVNSAATTLPFML
ncbi:MAG: hypothetical protein EBU90_04320 [Proteobacteria bacterium]|nr:hypothetical protein [Pseudomonadota bacterium]NBP15787.1 hypothetical protein [bacterium]